MYTLRRPRRTVLTPYLLINSSCTISAKSRVWLGPVRPDSTIGAIGHLCGIGSSSALIWSGLLM